MKITFDKSIHYEDYTIDGLEVLIQDDSVFLQIGNAYVKLDKEEARKLFTVFSVYV